MHQPILLFTFFILIIYFCAMEWYRLRTTIHGEIVRINPIFPGLENEVGFNIDVRLKDGQIVPAMAEPCAICTSPLFIGDKVDLIHRHDGYVVHVSLIRPIKHTGCSRMNR